MSPKAKILYERLDQIRKELGISRAELSRRLVHGPGLFTRLSSGRQKGLSQETLRRLKVMGYSLQEDGSWHIIGKTSKSPANAPKTLRLKYYSSGIPAGPPSLATDGEDYEWVEVAATKGVSESCYLVKVVGDSMIDAQIYDGDIATHRHGPGSLCE